MREAKQYEEEIKKKQEKEVGSIIFFSKFRNNEKTINSSHL